jgi:hypothetical protein
VVVGNTFIVKVKFCLKHVASPCPTIAVQTFFLGDVVFALLFV